jgi:hypothetical protein
MVDTGQQVTNSSQMVIGIGQMAMDTNKRAIETDLRPANTVKGGRHQLQFVVDSGKQAGSRQWPLGGRNRQFDGRCRPAGGIHLQRMVDSGQRLVDIGQQVLDTDQRVTPTTG